MTDQLVLATGNPGKVELFAGMLREVSARPWRLTGIDPLDAERSVPADYHLAAITKARAVGLAARADRVIGHDSGFEFACLDGQPGPITARTIASLGLGKLTANLVPHSAVRVVHCVALWTPAATWSVLHTDHRRVVADPQASCVDGPLPLGDLVTGSRLALRDCLAEILERVEGGEDG